MRRQRDIAAIGALALVLTCLATVAAAGKLLPVSVHAPRHPSTTDNVTISFRPRGHLPRGGYYYAVLVLQNYPHYSLKTPPLCAISSNMSMTAYGYQHRHKPIHLTLTPTKSAAEEWCPGGTYTGAVYAVPHKPPCSRAYPCFGKSTVYGEVGVCGGGGVCGTVPLPCNTECEEKRKTEREEATEPYSYPGGLPQPIDRRTRIVSHFQIHF